MTCYEFTDRLPELAAGGLTPAEQKAAAGHLTACARCRHAADELRSVLSLLKVAPAPPVHVDLPALYRASAEQRAVAVRRWRRLAIASSAAAAILLATFPLRLEVRTEGHEVVVRWGDNRGPKPPRPPALPQSPYAPAPPNDELRRLTEIVQGLASEADEREERYRQEVARLRGQLQTVQHLASEQSATDRQSLDALYTAQFPILKGDDR